MQTLRCVAGIDVHKKMLAVVVGRVGEQTIEVERAKFSTTTQDLKRLEDWLATRGVDEVVMESTGQYHKPVWLQLEGRFQLHLAQARSNRGPRGRKRDFTDALRLVKQFQGSSVKGGRNYNVAAGDILNIPPATPHLANPAPGGVSYMLVKVNVGMYPWSMIAKQQPNPR